MTPEILSLILEGGGTLIIAGLFYMYMQSSEKRNVRLDQRHREDRKEDRAETVKALKEITDAIHRIANK